MSGSSRSGTAFGDQDDFVSPDEEAAIRAQISLVDEEKLAALKDPGPTWREWLFYSALKWYIGLALLIGDAWVVATWLEATFVPGVERALLLAGSLALALYANYVVAQYLWHRPDLSPSRTIGDPYRRTWYRPFRYGRWTPEAVEARAGRDPAAAFDAGPDPREFL